MEVRTEIVYKRVWDSQYIAVIRDKNTGKQILTIPFEGKKPPEEIETKIITSVNLPPIIRISIELELLKKQGEE